MNCPARINEVVLCDSVGRLSCWCCEKAEAPQILDCLDYNGWVQASRQSYSNTSGHWRYLKGAENGIKAGVVHAGKFSVSTRFD